MQRPTIIAIAIVLVATLVFVWARWRGAEDPSAPAPAPSVAEPLRDEPVAVPEEAVEVALPDLDSSDDLLRDEFVDLGVLRPLIGIVETRELVRTLVAAVDSVAAGRSPRGQLGFLEPEGYFDVVERGDVLLIAAESFRRYDPVGAAVDALSVEAAVAAYLRLEPLADTAYGELGMPGTFRTRLLAAIDHLLETPPVGSDIEVIDAINRYRLADPALEALSEAQKHLLRAGPVNQERIQAKLRTVRDALRTAG